MRNGRNALKQIAGASLLALVCTLGAGMVQAQDRDHDRDRGRDQGYGPGQGGWDAPPGEYRDVQRQGFHDGVEGARRDFENHRRPNVNNRDEYRHPNVPGNVRRDYRDGFRRGYDVGVQHLTNGGGPRPY